MVWIPGDEFYMAKWFHRLSMRPTLILQPRHIAKKKTLFVAQRFNWIQARGADGRDHATHQGHSSEYKGGDNEHSGINEQPDIAGLRMLSHSTIQSECSHEMSDEIRQRDPQHSADKTDCQCLRQKVEEDVTLSRTEGLFQADLASALRHRH